MKFWHRMEMKISICLILRSAHQAHTSTHITVTSKFLEIHTYERHLHLNFECFRNRQTIKGVNFFGSNSEFVMSGSDCGNFFIWDKNSEAIVQWLPGDENGVVNCLEGHPHFPIIATSGLDHDIKIWGPLNPENVC